MPYRCEKCGRKWDDQSAVDNTYYCLRSCNGKLLPILTRGHNLVSLVSKLPSTLALLLHEYIQEENDYLALHRMCAAVEITTRFLTLIVLAEFWNRQISPEIPEKLQKDLVQHLDFPTLGSWRELLGSAVAALPGKKGKKECLLPELNQYEAKLRSELGFNNDQPMKKFLPMRNLVAHGGRLADETVKELLAAHTERFEALMGGLGFLSLDVGVKLVASPEVGAARLLCGIPREGKEDGRFEFPEFDRSELPAAFRQAGPDRMLLITPKGVLDLCPLNSYGEVFHVVKNELKGMNEDAMHIYARKAESGGREYAALGSKASHSRGSRSLEKRFDEIFQLEMWRARYRVDDALEKYSFSRRMDELSKPFIGRDAQVKAAAARIERAESGVFWLPGKPGMGKSAFMAKLVRSYFQRKSECDLREHVICVPYFFQVSEGHLCSTSAFIDAAMLHLSRALGRRTPNENDPSRLVEQFRSLLAEAAASQSGKIVLFLDGMDEIARVDSGFPNLIFACQQPKVLWVCAGRDEDALCERFSRDRCEWLLDSEHGLLAPLGVDDVRAFFHEELGHRLPQFFDRDKKKDDGTWTNGFVDEVIKRSGCLPLYLKLLVQDIRSGNFDFSQESESRLPNGLGEYYDRIVKEMGTDLTATIPAVTGLLAVAKDPLPLDTLADLLSDHEYARKGGQEFLRKALRYSNVMLSQASTAGGSIGYILSTTSYKDHVLKSKDLELTVELAVERFCSLPARWRNLDKDSHLLDYALRYAAAHLADARKGEDLWELLRDEDYRKRQIEQLEQYTPSLQALKHGIMLYSEENQKQMTPEYIGRLAWLVLKYGETGEQSRTDVSIAWQWAREGRMEDALKRLEFVDEEYFLKAVIYLLWIEADRMKQELGEHADYSKLPEERTGSFANNANRVLEALDKRVPFV